MNIELVLKAMEANLFLLTKKQVDSIKESVLKSKEKMKLLEKLGNEVLEMKEYSVLDKEGIAPSGDKKDYVSFGTYWWPNPDTGDGLPYIVRDGELNPEGFNYDKYNMKKVGYCAWISGLFYMITNEKKYLEKFVRFIDTWFLDGKTGMNPHLKYAQFIPGICEGRDIGLIDTATFLPFILNVFEMLEKEEKFSYEFVDGFRKWIEEYTKWIINSPLGESENKRENNHGTWHDIQIISLSLFTGRNELAKKQLSTGIDRLEKQIDEEGKQIFEIKRTRSFGYSIMGLKGQMDLLTLGEHLEENHWDNALIEKSCKWIEKYLTLEKKWEYEQITPVDYSTGIYPILMMNKKYRLNIDLMNLEGSNSIPNLLFL